MHLSRSRYYQVTNYFWLALLFVFIVGVGCSSKIRNYEPTKDFNVSTYTAPGFINIHYVQFDGKTLLFDSGNVGDGEKIARYFEEQGFDLAEVDYLIITHGHADHAGNAHYFKEKYGMQIITGAGEAEIIASGGEDPNLCPRGFKWRMSSLSLPESASPSRAAHTIFY